MYLLILDSLGNTELLLILVAALIFFGPAAVIRAIEHGKKTGADVVVLPETCIQGYTSFDWFLDPDVVRCVLQPLEKITAATEGITAVVGTVRPNDQPTGRKLFNSAAIIRDRKLIGFADKTLLPEYDVFDDPRYFEPARERRLFTVGDCKMGVAVCEDFWNDKTFWKERLYGHDPADELISMGSELLISINASPFNREDGPTVRDGFTPREDG